MHHFIFFKPYVSTLVQIVISVLTISYFSDIDIPVWHKVIAVFFVNLFYFLVFIIFELFRRYFSLKDKEEDKNE